MNKHFFINALSLSLCIFLLSCKSTKINCYHLDEVNKRVPGEVLYNLNRTVLNFDIQLKRTIIKKGPLAQYANKFLGINDATMNDYLKWEIIDVTLNTSTEKDPSQYYCLQALKDKNNTISSLVKWSENGYILSMQHDELNEINNRENNIEATAKGDEGLKIIIDGNMIEKVDTFYKTVLQDSVFIKIPIYRKQMVEKSEELKAQEIADYIINLRSARFNIISNSEDYNLGGDALKIILDQLNQLETEYLSLFTGKKYEQTFTSKLRLVPDSGYLDNSVALFYFSDQEGISYSPGSSNTPVFLNINSKNELDILKKYVNRLPNNNNKNVIFSRLPEQTNIRLIHNNSTLIDQSCHIEQFGIVLPVPLKMITINQLK